LVGNCKGHLATLAEERAASHFRSFPGEPYRKGEERTSETSKWAREREHKSTR